MVDDNLSGSSNSLSGRTWKAALVGIFLLACLIRLLALYSLSKTFFIESFMPDEFLYHAWAQQIANGTYSSSSVYQFAPLPAYVMGVVYKILSPDIVHIRFLNIFLGSATCILVSLIGTSLHNQVTGIVSGFVAALYKPFIFWNIVPMKTTLSVFLFALSVWLFVTALAKPSAWRIFVLGAASGLMVSVRQNTLPLMPFIVVMVMWKWYADGVPRKELGLGLLGILAGIILSLGPFVIRNCLVAGECALTTHQAGFVLYLANHKSTPTTFATRNAYEQQFHFQIEASRRAGHKLSPSEASAFWIREAVEQIKRDPVAGVTRLWRKMLLIFNRVERGTQYNLEFVSQFATFLKLPFVGLSFVLPLGMAGMLSSAVSSKAARYVSILFVVYAFTLVLFFTTERLRLPLFVVLVPFAVMGIASLLFHLRSRAFGHATLYAGMVALFGLLVFVPVGGPDMSAHYNIYATFADARGEEDEAIRYWKLSAELSQTFSNAARLALAKKYLSKTDALTARTYLAQVPDSSAVAAQKYELLGDLWTAQGQPEQAIAAYQRSLSLNTGLLGPRRKLARLLSKTDKEGALEQYRAMKDVSSYYYRGF